MNFKGIRSGTGTDVTDAIFYDLTPTYPTARLEKVRFTIWLNSDGVKVAPGVWYSDDGITWEKTQDSAPNLGILDDYNGSTTGWITAQNRTILSNLHILPDHFEDLSDSGSGTDLSNNRLFCKFGLFVTLSSGDTPKGGVAAMNVSFADEDGGTITTTPTMVLSGGGQTKNYTALTGPLSTNDVAEARVSLEVESNSGVTVDVGVEYSDDGINWGTPSLFGSTSTSGDEIVYGKSFTAVASTKKFVRFIVGAANIDQGSNEYHPEYMSAVASLRVDWRS